MRRDERAGGAPSFAGGWAKQPPGDCAEAESGGEPIAMAKLAIEEEGRCDILLFVDGQIPENIAPPGP